uniref:Gem-associated protein 7 n=1 Tax=Macaca nemestrina TaxID=9545 RepID=A0A2K6C8L5_MACNE
MQAPVTFSVPVLQLPQGPDGLSRGFAPEARVSRSSRIPGIPGAARYLRSLLAMVNRKVSFTLHEGVHVATHFGATDLDVANFYVSQLQTPIGMQAEALDIISYTFKP